MKRRRESANRRKRSSIFWGYSFGRCYSPKTGHAYIATVPSQKRVIRICETIRELTGRDQTLLDHEKMVGKLNRTMSQLHGVRRKLRPAETP